MEPPAHRLHAKDFLWGLAAPIYVLLGTLRHEGSHALVGMATGAKLTSFVFWPSRGHWGYVEFATDPTWPSLAAPYVVDVAVFALGLWLCRRVPQHLHWLWVNLAVILVASPAIDSIYNYVMAFVRGGDVAGLFMVFGPVVAHAWFLGTGAWFVLGSLRVMRGT